MKPKTIALILLVCALIVIAGTLVFYSYFYLMDYKEVKADFHVVNNSIGMDADTDALHFGGVPYQGVSKRSIIISYPRDSFVKIKFDPVVKWLSVDKNNFLLRAGEKKSIVFYAQPVNQSIGQNYSTMVKIYFYRTLS